MRQSPPPASAAAGGASSKLLALLSANRRFGLRHDVLDREPEQLEQRSAGRRSPVALHADKLAAWAEIFLPTLLDTGLDGDAGGHLLRQHRLAVGCVLLVEQFPARHADEPCLDAFLRELL